MLHSLMVEKDSCNRSHKLRTSNCRVILLDALNYIDLFYLIKLISNITFQCSNPSLLILVGNCMIVLYN